MKPISLNRSKFDRQKEQLRKKMENHLREQRDSMERKLRHVAAQVAQDLAEESFPLPRNIGPAIAAIREDIGRVFISAGKAYAILKQYAGERSAAAFYAAYESGDFQRARTVLLQSGSPIRAIAIGTVRPELHQQARSPETGRVTLAAPLLIVPKSQLESYIANCVKELGKTASGWNACAVKLGAGEAGSSWKRIALHGSDSGRVSVRNDEEGITVVIKNLRPLSRKHIPASRVAGIVDRGQALFLSLLRQ